MKFLLLKTLLIRRGKDEGFTLPIVIAIGLMMILLSAVNLARSSEENLNTLSQQGLSNAIAMAETGVIRYRELLDRNRLLAVYNLSEWTENYVTEQICNQISITGGGWADSTSNTWRDITEDIDGDNTSETIGSYKIVDYIYDNDNDTSTSNNEDIDITDDDNNDDGSPPRGLLTIKGRSLDGSEAQLQVEIPIGSNAGEDTDGDGVPDEGDMDGLSPAIWIRNNNQNISSIGDNLTVNGGNIVLSVYSNGDEITPCTAPAQDIAGNDLTAYTAAGTLRIDPRNLPEPLDFGSLNAVDSLIADAPKLINGNIDFNNIATAKPIFADNFPDALYLGGREINEATDDETAPRISNALFDKGDEQIYYYKVNGDLVIDNNQKLVVPSDSRVRVILEVTGNVEILDNAAIINQSDVDNGTISLSTYSTSRYLEIHAGENVNISGSGNVNIKAFIYAPNGTVNISESVDVNIFGSVWAQDWNNTSTGAVVVTADDYKFYSISDNRTPRPITYRIEDWERQDVN